MEENTPRDVVLRFAREMNRLQTLYTERFQTKEDPVDQLHRDYQLAVGAVYARFLTPRLRTCLYAVAEPPTFAGVTEEARIVEAPDGREFFVHVFPVTGFLDFRFSLRQHNGTWLIDSFQQRYRSEDRTIVHNWVYGSF